MGTGYKGGATHFHSISENVDEVKNEYKYYNGYFGDPGIGRSFVREISSANPIDVALTFYDKISYGGIEYNMPNGKGKYTKLADGTILSYRVTSSSDGSPAVEINIKKSNDSGGVKYQKIHFVKGN